MKIRIIIYLLKLKNINFLTPKFINEKYGIWLLGYDGDSKDYSLDVKILFR